ncbi:scavenger receptor cysteine-rich type 1 protein M130-like isoform X2 [Acanthochromis polyacanthus]|uniref:scavenger receptor cysteine-rich type 1 protein M130-like isoform X2 n=1 Tax=Acanthochromis polyacanthus TaxID=80966 RepID=UPI0022343B04|nr:scavenger receptor cysteine-rich type 1 protein M130-like isoform X2 [Acanthochromis polyacanthus]
MDLRFRRLSLFSRAALHLLLLATLVLHCHTESVPRFIKLPDDQTGISGGVASFICQAVGEPKPQITWTKKGKKVSSQRFEVIEFDDGSGSLLRIQPLRTSRDEAIYECTANNSLAEISINAKLTVLEEKYKPHGFPTIDMGPQLKVVEKTRTATMLCAASGNPDPEIYWFKDFLPVDISSSNGRIKQLRSGTLQIENSEESDQGKYECVAVNGAGTRYSAPANLYVRVRRVPPRFAVPPTNHEVMPGGSVNLTCVAVGSPMPYVKWMSGEVELTREEEMPIGRNVLELTKIRQSANYTCVALSSLGMIETTAQITVKDSVRLVGGTHRCSGRLQVKRNQVWSSVCSDGFDLQDAEVVCRELGCGSPSGFKEELYGEAPEWIPEFRCGGHESALLHCERSDRDTCSPETTVTLTCSAPDQVRLVGNRSTCAGELQMKVHEDWRPAVDEDWYWNHTWTSAAAAAASAVCSQLGCGSIVTTDLERIGSKRPVWRIESSCFQSAISLQDCLFLSDEARDSDSLQVICSDLLVQPNISVSSSRLEVQQQKVRVLLGSNFSIICSTRPQYPGGSFQLVFNSSSSTLNYVLPAVTHSAFFLFPAAEGLHRGTYTCIYHLYVFSHNFSSTSRPIYLIPSDSVRLVGGTHRCSGRLQVKRNQVWSSVCSDGFDLQDAEVVCRELGCGSPSGFKEELYGEAPEWIPEFRCGGHESALLHCERSDRDTCSPGTTVTLTCSAPDQVRLVGNRSTCAGELQMKVHEDWRPAVDEDWYWNQKWTSASASAVCSQLRCGSIVTTVLEEIGSDRPVWFIKSSCFQSTLSLQDCLVLSDEARNSYSLQVVCSDLLVQPNISVSSSRLEVQQQKVRVLLGSNFSIICSTRPQYPGGSFQLVFNSSSSTLNYVLPAVTHSAFFLFPAAEGLHRGTYTCIYHLYVFSHNFSSTSRPIYLIPSAPLMDLIIRLVVHLLVMVLLISVTCFYSRKYSVETRSRNEETNVVAELQ